MWRQGIWLLVTALSLLLLCDLDYSLSLVSFFSCEMRKMDSIIFKGSFPFTFYDSVIPGGFSHLTFICKGHPAIYTIEVFSKSQMVLNKILCLEQDICGEMAHVRYDLFNSEQLSNGSLTHPVGITASQYYYKRPPLCSQKELPYYLVKTKWFPLCPHWSIFRSEHMILSLKESWTTHRKPVPNLTLALRTKLKFFP